MRQPLEEYRPTLANIWKIIVVCTFLVGASGYFYRLESKVDSYNNASKAQIELAKTEWNAKFEQMKQEQTLLHQVIEKRLEVQEKKQEASDRAVNELSKAVDRAATVLERLDTKLGKP